MSDKYLPTIYYVYFHTDPRTGEITYVGSGTRERAWISRRNNRNNDNHFEWLEELHSEGITPDEYVTIEFKHHDKSIVLEKERKLIEELKPRFNQTLKKWSWCMVLSVDQLKLAKNLRAEGMIYSKIAEEVGVSTMTVYRALNGETKGYRDE